MFAVIETGGKQYTVRKGEAFGCEKLTCAPGDTVELESVLLIAEEDENHNVASIKFGEPFLPTAKVILQVLEHKKDKKIIVFKKRRRKNFRRKVGHRQLLSIVRVIDIQG